MSENNIEKLQEENAQLRTEITALREALEKGDEALATNEIRLKLAYLSTIQALVRAIEAKDPYTVGHSNMVAKVAVAVARKMDLSEDECERVRIAGTLMNLGKITIDRDILLKREELDEQERAQLHTVPQVGAEIVEPIIYPWDVASLIYQSHERLDGSGYPDGLQGEAIVAEARILGLADSFVAMIVRRAYRDAHGEEEAMKYFREQAGKAFDKDCVHALAEVIAADPELREELDQYKSTLRTD